MSNLMASCLQARVSRLRVHTWNKVTHKPVTAVDPGASATHMSHSVHMSAAAASVSCCQRAGETSAWEAPVFQVMEREVRVPRLKCFVVNA